MASTLLIFTLPIIASISTQNYSTCGITTLSDATKNTKRNQDGQFFPMLPPNNNDNKIYY